MLDTSKISHTKPCVVVVVVVVCRACLESVAARRDTNPKIRKLEELLLQLFHGRGESVGQNQAHLDVTHVPLQ